MYNKMADTQELRPAWSQGLNADQLNKVLALSKATIQGAKFDCLIFTDKNLFFRLEFAENSQECCSKTPKRLGKQVILQEQYMLKKEKN